MYKKALKDLVETAANKFFQEKTGYKKTCCFKVELKQEHSMLFFTASVAAADNDPKYGEYFTVYGYLSFDINITRITDNLGKKELYNRHN